MGWKNVKTFGRCHLRVASDAGQIIKVMAEIVEIGLNLHEYTGYTGHGLCKAMLRCQLFALCGREKSLSPPFCLAVNK
jgi:hypothetical protein